jgi:hypothetical protein
MINEETLAQYRRLSDPERAERLQLLQDALEIKDNPHTEQIKEHIAAMIATRPSNASQTATDLAGELPGRRAGSPAANQFGVFQVHAASDKQIGFLRKLIATKELTGIEVPASLDGISKTAASALIDRLIDRPERAGVAATGSARPASDKQIGFLTKLLAEKEHDYDADAILQAAADAQITGLAASGLIDSLLKMARKVAPAPVPAAEIAAGAYRVGDRIIRVYLGQQSGRMLCTELVDPTARTREEAWKYLGQAHRFIPADATPMTPAECERVAAGQADHGWCCVCGRELDQPVSVARGIGPVCYGRQQAFFV